MARTTLAVDDDLLARLKERAAREGRPMQSLVNDLLRQSLARVEETGSYRLEILGWTAELQPGVDILDRDALFELMDRR